MKWLGISLFVISILCCVIPMPIKWNKDYTDWEVMRPNRHKGPYADSTIYKKLLKQVPPPPDDLLLDGSNYNHTDDIVNSYEVPQDVRDNLLDQETDKPMEINTAFHNRTYRYNILYHCKTRNCTNVVFRDFMKFDENKKFFWFKDMYYANIRTISDALIPENFSCFQCLTPLGYISDEEDHRKRVMQTKKNLYYTIDVTPHNETIVDGWLKNFPPDIYDFDEKDFAN